jgi:hypothetical protein
MNCEQYNSWRANGVADGCAYIEACSVQGLERRESVSNEQNQ